MDYARIAAACNAERMKSLWKRDKDAKGERLGQWFMNNYAPKLTPDIFYEEDTKESLKHITEYLYNCHYIYEVPPTVDRREQVLKESGQTLRS